jgi:hypothetical protein
MQTISLRLPDDLLAQLDREAKARGVTKSLLVRESLKKALYQTSPGGGASCYDLARDARLVDQPRHKELRDTPQKSPPAQLPAILTE